MRTSWISIRLIPQVASSVSSGPAVEMTNDSAFQRHTDAAGYQESDRQRDQRIERQPLRRQLCQRLLHQPTAVGAIISISPCAILMTPSNP